MEQHDHDQKEWLDADLIASYDTYQNLLVTIWPLASHFFSSNRVVIIF